MKSSEISILISKKIKHRRLELGLNRRDLVRAATLHDSSIYVYEYNPLCKISAISLYRISKALNVSMDYFFEDIEEVPNVKEVEPDYEKEEMIHEWKR